MQSIISALLIVWVFYLHHLLKRARAELQTVADHAPAAIAHVAARGDNLKYLFVNDRYAALYGRLPAEVIGKHPKDVLGPEIFARSRGNMGRALRGETVNFDLTLGDKVVQVIYHPDCSGEQGRVQGFIGVITDVTELRKLQDRHNERH